MKKTFSFALIICAIFSGGHISAQDYLGQETPGFSPQLFGSQIVSTRLKERDITISPDGTEIYYTTFTNGFDGNIFYVKLEDGKWSLPKIAPFSGNKEDLEPAFSPDGNKLFFASKRQTNNYDIWYVERQSGGEWSNPISVGSPINTSANEFYPSIASSGTLYFTASYSHGVGREDIWSSKLVNGVYQTPVPLSTVNNAENDEYNAFIDPNEQYIYFCSFNRADDLGGGDIYLSRKQGSGWSVPEHLGGQVNSNKLDYSPFVSPDGRYLFFTSERGSTEQQSTNPFDIEAVAKALLSPGSSGSDIYWIKK